MLCVIAKLIEEATEKLAAVRGAAFSDAIQIKPLYGHITLATYTGDHEREFIQSCRELLDDIPVFETVYEKIEVLEDTSIIVATPNYSSLLYTMHARIAERFDDSLDPWTKKDVWYPHTTLFYDPKSDLYAISERMKQAFKPFTAKIDRIEFSRVLDHGYEIAGFMNLKEPQSFETDTENGETNTKPAIYR